MPVYVASALSAILITEGTTGVGGICGGTQIIETACDHRKMPLSKNISNEGREANSSITKQILY